MSASATLGFPPPPALPPVTLNLDGETAAVLAALLDRVAFTHDGWRLAAIPGAIMNAYRDWPTFFDTHEHAFRRVRHARAVGGPLLLEFAP